MKIVRISSSPDLSGPTALVSGNWSGTSLYPCGIMCRARSTFTKDRFHQDEKRIPLGFRDRLSPRPDFVRRRALRTPGSGDAVGDLTCFLDIVTGPLFGLAMAGGDVVGQGLEGMRSKKTYVFGAVMAEETAA